MITIIAESIAWIATFFRGYGMLAKGEEKVKYLVSAGNLFWMINGILTHNMPLIISNGFCLLAILYEVLSKRRHGYV